LNLKCGIMVSNFAFTSSTCTATAGSVLCVAGAGVGGAVRGELGWVPKRVQGWRHDVALFALAAAAIMHCYNAERDVFRSKYLNVLDFVFGNTGRVGYHFSPRYSAVKTPIIGDTPTPRVVHVINLTPGSDTTLNTGHGRQSIKHVGSFAVLANPPQMASPAPTSAAYKGEKKEPGGKRVTLKTLLSSPERKKK
jgi:hypothetical protein